MRTPGPARTPRTAGDRAFSHSASSPAPAFRVSGLRIPDPGGAGSGARGHRGLQSYGVRRGGVGAVAMATARRPRGGDGSGCNFPRRGSWALRAGAPGADERVSSSDPLCALGAEPAHRALAVLGVVAALLLGGCRLMCFFIFLNRNVFFQK